ncbi:DbpA RNA binding domain-containing protein [Halalkalicoccus salilacus]|uniref:DbpA RNA binding domain-containing protein n=1 Tax=Halalkalicoccus sp. GCM10025704 TaxID=3252662 RepID=UPI00361A3080
MTTLLVRGLENEGPGDIVGAFVAEADVDPDAIGDIDIDGTEAIVEVTDPIVETMDDGRIGGSEVDVIRLDDDTKVVREYVEEYSRLVELEREAEMDRHDREIRECSGREREAKGRAILDLEGRDEGEGLAATT